jgi:hypothetical protein
MLKPALLASLLLIPVAATAETAKPAEQEFKNIQVFKGVPASQIDATMDVMAGALGVGCDHCHVKAEAPGTPWPMEKDDKAAKRTARKMVVMMQKINQEFFGGDQEVTCATCHNGRTEPRTVPPMEKVAGEEEHEEEAKPPSLTAKQILDKWVQASGGAAAWAKLKTRVSKGKSERGPRSMDLEIAQAAPDKLHVTLTMKMGVFEQGWDGKEGWRKFGGRAMPLESVAEVRRQAQFAPPLGLPKLLTDLKVRRDAKVGASNAHVLDGKQGDLRVRLFFDATTGLLSRMTVREPTPAGDLADQTDYEDYRAVDGVKLPFLVKMNKGGEAATTTYAEIKHNAPVDNAQFAPPPKPAAPAKP